MQHKTQKKTPSHTRTLAVLICQDVIENGSSLGNSITTFLDDKEIEPQDRGFIQTLCFGLLRWYWQLDDQLKPLLQKPIKSKDSDVKYTLLLGLLQIIHLKIPEHAAVSDTVKCCKHLGKPWAENLVNACLRSFIRKLEGKKETPKYHLHYSHPQWLQDHEKEIYRSNNQEAPLCLRINSKKCSRDEYLELLKEHDIDASQDPHSNIGIRIPRSLPVSQLPKFDEGWASVQDTASQVIHDILHIHENDRVLDACAAPGGKTSLLMENAPSNITMHALDIDGRRNLKLQNTLSRLDLNASILEGDASKPEEWWDKKPYQKILVDAPCSGLGIIRRHPDIKHLRHQSDLEALGESQKNILKACWSLLEEDGLLLYTTCSILPEENVEQIETFLQSTPNAQIENIDLTHTLPQKFGLQALPGYSDTDGFYYCLLRKILI